MLPFGLVNTVAGGSGVPAAGGLASGVTDGATDSEFAEELFGLLNEPGGADVPVGGVLEDVQTVALDAPVEAAPEVLPEFVSGDGLAGSGEETAVANAPVPAPVVPSGSTPLQDPVLSAPGGPSPVVPAKPAGGLPGERAVPVQPGLATTPGVGLSAGSAGKGENPAGAVGEDALNTVLSGGAGASLPAAQGAGVEDGGLSVDGAARPLAENAASAPLPITSGVAEPGVGAAGRVDTAIASLSTGAAVQVSEVAPPAARRWQQALPEELRAPPVAPAAPSVPVIPIEAADTLPVPAVAVDDVIADPSVTPQLSVEPVTGGGAAVADAQGAAAAASGLGTAALQGEAKPGAIPGAAQAVAQPAPEELAAKPVTQTSEPLVSASTSGPQVPEAAQGSVPRPLGQSAGQNTAPVADTGAEPLPDQLVPVSGTKPSDVKQAGAAKEGSGDKPKGAVSLGGVGPAQPAANNANKPDMSRQGIAGAERAVDPAPALAAQAATFAVQDDPAAPLMPLELTAGSEIAGSIRGGDLAGAMRTESLQTPNQAQSGQVATQVAAEIARNLKNGQTRFQMRFDPPELGRVEVNMRVSADGAVQAHLIVERPETLDMFLRDQRGLERALEAAGLNTSSENLQFSLKQDGGNGFASSDGQSDQAAGNSGDPGASEGEQETVDEAVIRLQLAEQRGGLDVKI